MPVVAGALHTYELPWGSYPGAPARGGPRVTDAMRRAPLSPKQ